MNTIRHRLERIVGPAIALTNALMIMLMIGAALPAAWAAPGAPREAVSPGSPGAAGAPAAPPTQPMPRYVRPRNGPPDPARVLGSTSRGTHDESLSIAVIAPDHVGFTTSAQPTLYWFASAGIAADVELTVQADDATAPLIETRLRPSGESGLIAVPLAAHGASLDPERDYRWSISVIGDPKNRSKDIITSGFIRRSGPPRAQASVSELAEDGLWYDAIATLGEQIARSPDDSLLRRQRAALLRQVGLDRPAEADTQHRPAR